ncbi:PH domain-containing protein [Natrinema salsiterrestre]|uniref:PH domain-containing protein n=1 Tax=Natrinema salsiterrestre TaxID=2950540 RepID=A0A9Q4L1P3_9EURY|nr:PH domain-containing protein [Natrinema salsiterrestre]MDF9745213.1 PH domain-containing protein [Natrinema salsiterrestre]
MSTEPTDEDVGVDLEWLSLDDGEDVIWAGGPDRRTLIPAFAIGIPLSIVLIGLVIIASEYLRVTNTHYVVTTRALYKKTGVLSRDVKRIEHAKVQDISYSQSALGTHFGYGSVEVSTAGGSGVEMAFKSVPDPKAVQQRISERIKRERGESGDEHTKDDVLEEILTELRAIRTAVEEDAPGRSSAENRAADRQGDGHQSYEYDEDRSV